jgi:enolase
MKDTAIKSVFARQLLDCNRRPVLEVDVVTQGGDLGRGSSPTGSSVGMYESYVLRDGDPNEYRGMSVHKAEAMVRDVIAPAIIGMDVTDQRAIDQRMIDLDGTPNKQKLGGNSICSVSIACIRAAAQTKRMPLYKYLAGGEIKTLPLPTFNILNGGKYGEINLCFNECLIAPYKAQSVEEAAHISVMVLEKLGSVIKKYLGGAEPVVGRSYGWAPPSDDPVVCYTLMAEAADQCGVLDKVAFCIDAASSEQYDEKTATYLLKGKRVSADELIAFTKQMSERFNLLFIEDLLDENDWDGFVKAKKEIVRSNIIGDDFTVTNPERIKKAYEMGAIDGFILKPNQVGSITESIDAVEYAKRNNLLVIPSGRAGGIIGDVVCDLAAGLGVNLTKNGAPRSGERIDKLNFLLRAASENPQARLIDNGPFVRFNS